MLRYLYLFHWDNDDNNVLFTIVNIYLWLVFPINTLFNLYLLTHNWTSEIQPFTRTDFRWLLILLSGCIFYIRKILYATPSCTMLCRWEPKIWNPCRGVPSKNRSGGHLFLLYLYLPYRLTWKPTVCLPLWYKPNLFQRFLSAVYSIVQVKLVFIFLTLVEIKPISCLLTRANQDCV